MQLHWFISPAFLFIFYALRQHQQCPLKRLALISAFLFIFYALRQHQQCPLKRLALIYHLLIN